MEEPVDLANLHEMTDGDAELEKTLFAEFLSSFEKGIGAMAKNCVESAHDVWRSEAHALKGTSLNLGAARLGELCKKAQEEFQALPQDKSHMLDEITTEYGRVKAFLMQQGAEVTG